MPITFCAKRFVRNVLGESFGRKFWADFFLEPHFESGAGCWAGLGAGLAWAELAGLGLGGCWGLGGGWVVEGLWK